MKYQTREDTADYFLEVREDGSVVVVPQDYDMFYQGVGELSPDLALLMAQDIIRRVECLRS